MIDRKDLAILSINAVVLACLRDNLSFEMMEKIEPFNRALDKYDSVAEEIDAMTDEHREYIGVALEQYIIGLYKSVGEVLARNYPDASA